MKIAIIYDSKNGNTKQVAEYLAEKIKTGDNQISLFRTKKSKPEEVLDFQPDAVLIGGPTHFGKPARTLGNFLKDLGKFEHASRIQKAAVFNCFYGNDVCTIIQEQISNALPHLKIFEKSLPVCTAVEGKNWKEFALPNNWKEHASSFLSAFIEFC